MASGSGFSQAEAVAVVSTRPFPAQWLLLHTSGRQGGASVAAQCDSSTCIFWDQGSDCGVDSGVHRAHCEISLSETPLIT